MKSEKLPSVYTLNFTATGYTDGNSIKINLKKHEMNSTRLYCKLAAKTPIYRETEKRIRPNFSYKQRMSGVQYLNTERKINLEFSMKFYFESEEKIKTTSEK